MQSYLLLEEQAEALKNAEEPEVDTSKPQRLRDRALLCGAIPQRQPFPCEYLILGLHSLAV